VAFTIGQRVGDYEVLDLLGTGGMGCVYRVRHVISQRMEAMKVLLADLQAEPELASRFLREIRTLATLDHPNIAQLHTALQIGNELLMVMEFVDGLTLQKMAQQAPLLPQQIINYMHQLMAALSFAHARGVVHRDIKPANILVTADGVVKLTDFGIAKSKAISELTQPGTTVGSLNYMSPEQATGKCSVDGRSDIYSLGITMYELLAGCLPFADESAYVVLHNQLHHPPRPPIELNPLLPKALNDVILKALEKDPANRFQSAASFSDALTRASGIAATVPLDRSPLSGRAAPATPAKVPGSRRQRGAATSKFLTARPRRIWITAEAFAGLAIVGGIAFSVSHVGRAKVMAKDAGLTTAQHTSSLATPSHPFAVVAGAVPGALGTLEEPSRIALLDAAVTPRGPAGKTIALASLAGPGMKGSRADSAPRVTPTPQSPAMTAELQTLRDEKAKLEVRAAALRTSVQRLKSQREAEGDGLGQDVAGAYVRMNAYLSAEKEDLEDGDVSAARDHLERAAHEVNVLEGLFANSPSAN
jgi:eukaryotic-like serine/threonine-protein kinase